MLLHPGLLIARCQCYNSSRKTVILHISLLTRLLEMDNLFRLVAEENVNFGNLRLYMKKSTNTHPEATIIPKCATDIEIGGTIHGRVGITLNRTSAVFVKGIWVKLRALSLLRNKNPVVEKLNSVDHLEKEEDYASGGLYHVLMGVCSDFSDVKSLGVREQAARERQRSVAAACEYIELKPMGESSNAEHVWDFYFTLPEACPVSYVDEFAETLCSVTAVVDSPSVPRALSQMTHYLNVNSAQRNSLGRVHTSVPTPKYFLIDENFPRFFSWFHICGISKKSKFKISLHTTAPDGFQVAVSQSDIQHTLSLPVCCTISSNIESANPRDSKNRYQLKVCIVKESCYGKRKSKLARVKRSILWSNVIEVDNGALEVS